MTELAVREDRPVDYWPTDRQPPEDPTGGRLVAWAASLSAAHQIGTALCETSFVPQHFRGKPQDAAAAILFGDEIGLTPTQALRSVYVISGTPALYARTMAAIVMHHGHEVWTVEKTDTKVTVAGKRRGSTKVIEETWTTARAQRAGYTNNKKYATDPQAMLLARAIADVCRQIAPDALAGLAYTVEEMEAAEPETTTVTRGGSTGPRKVSREKPQPAEPEFDQPEPGPAPQPDVEAAPEPATRAQVTKLNILIQEQGLTERQAKLDYLSAQVGRTITSSNDLTKAEAHSLIAALDAEPTTQQAMPEPEGWQS